MKTVGVISLGCPKNRVDSEMLLGLLVDADYRIVPNARDAQVIIVNTCGFIESAKQEAIDALLEMASYKHNGRLEVLIATGCLVQRYGAELRIELPEVDAFLGVAEYSRIREAIREAYAGKRPLYADEGERFLQSRRVLTTPPYTAYVKISDGCDNRCAYCAIPMIRGKYQSRPFGDIISECERLSKDGAGEITFVAQDSTRFMKLPELLEAADALGATRWLRVLYCYPDAVTDRLLDAIAALPKACKYIDIPLQHISARILRNMNRRGAPELIRGLIARCRERGLYVRTSMIVGFPGETESEFDELLEFIIQARFERLGAFAYSPEEGTPAYDMPGRLPGEVISDRLNRLMAEQQRISLKINRQRVGKTYLTLTEGKTGAMYYGRTMYEAPEIDGRVYFTARSALQPGRYTRVRVTSASEYDLTGEEAI
jgi:ribosomal protein S12 methylthiotransferase